MPTFRDMKGRPVHDPGDEPDPRDVRPVVIRTAQPPPPLSQAMIDESVDQDVPPAGGSLANRLQIMVQEIELLRRRVVLLEHLVLPPPPPKDPASESTLDRPTDGWDDAFRLATVATQGKPFKRVPSQ